MLRTVAMTLALCVACAAAAHHSYAMFDGSRTADETAGKPHPLMLQELMREFGTDPGRTLIGAELHRNPHGSLR